MKRNRDHLLLFALLGFPAMIWSQCLNAPEGLYPSSAYSLSVCDGTTDETIAPDCYAGEYSEVNVIAGNLYTFSSSIATDYLTISNSSGTSVYAHGFNPYYSPTANGVVRFYMHTDSTCGVEQVNRSRIVICSINIGLDELSESDVKLYPNPTSDKISIEGERVFDEIRIISIEGRILNGLKPHNSITEMDVKALERGTYFVRIIIGDQSITKEFIKE